MSRLRLLATVLLLSTPPTAVMAAGPVKLAVVPMTAPWSPDCAGPSRQKDATIQERCGLLEALADEVRAGALAVLDPQQVMVVNREHGREKPGAAQYVVSGNLTVIEGSWLATLQLHEASTSKLLKSGERVRRGSQLDLLDAIRPAAEALLRGGLGVDLQQAGGASAPDHGVATPVEGAGAVATGGQVLVAFESAPEGASVLLDGKPLCQTPCRKRIAGGSHEVLFRKEGRKESAQRFSAGPGTVVRASLELPTAKAAAKQGGSAPGMIELPGGTFRMAVRGDTVTVRPFLLDETAVTAAAYAACVNAGGCREPATGSFRTYGAAGKEDHPVNYVDWEQATAYCAWAGKRLPTEEEREWAARGADAGTAYPWGNDPPSDQLCWSGLQDRDSKGLGTCAVGSVSRGDSPQGIMDLSGGVTEWTSTAFDSTSHVKRGGSWRERHAAGFAAGFRFNGTSASEGTGFRCAANPGTIRGSAPVAPARTQAPPTPAPAPIPPAAKPAPAAPPPAPPAPAPAPAPARAEPPAPPAPVGAPAPAPSSAEPPAPPESPAPAMVRLPGGSFKLGDRTVKVAPFLMDPTEVTAEAFSACVKAVKCRKPAAGDFATFGSAGRESHPVNWVDWNQAAAFCTWAGKRLPTEEEWEWAARGADQGTTFPWGNERPADQVCWNGGSVQRKAKGLGTCAAGSLAAGSSPQGVADLVGNVWEWTSTSDGAGKVARGNGWVAVDVPKPGRLILTVDRRDEDVGFRCVKTIRPE